MENKEHAPEVKTDTVPAVAPSAVEPESKENKERYLAENEMFRRHFAALQADIDALDKKYGKDPDAPDVVKVLSEEVATLKNSVEQIRSYLEQLANSGQRQSAPQAQWYQPQPVFPHQGVNTLPYIQTPNIQPIMPQPINNTGRF